MKQTNYSQTLYEKASYGLSATLPLYSMFFDGGYQAIDSILSKTQSYFAKVSNFGLLFEERDRIRKDNLANILNEECLVGSYLSRLNSMCDYSSPRRQSLESQLSRLDNMKRIENVKCWQDKAKLVTDTLEALAKYSNAKSKEKLVN